MANFQATGPKKITPRIRAWVAIIVLFVIITILGNATWNIYVKNSIANENKLAAVRQLEDLKERKKVIKEKLDKLKTPEGREEEIRKNLPMAKEGEYVITIVDDEDKKVSSDTEASTTIKKGLWERWFR
jgi:cell division protein FtsB